MIFCVSGLVLRRGVLADEWKLTYRAEVVGTSFSYRSRRVERSVALSSPRDGEWKLCLEGSSLLSGPGGNGLGAWGIKSS